MPRPFLRSVVGPALSIACFVTGVGLTSVVYLKETLTLKPVSFSTLSAGESKEPVPVPIVEEADSRSCWGDESENPQFGPIKLPNGLRIDTICGTVFARTKDGELAWSRNTDAPLTDSPKFVDGELVVIGADLHLLALDPETGVVNWQQLSNGRALHVQLEPIGNSYVLLSNMSGYDGSYQACVEVDPEESDKCERKEPDKVALLRKDKVLRVWSVPPESELEIRKNRIFAVYQNGRRQKRVELKPQ